ncbi:MAG: RNA polymerase sigma factor RpoD/SigA [Bacteroidales bacterium]|nr:RNA polymerase sigma factor RpoD/SigA [Bacteroidales bacterium]
MSRKSNSFTKRDTTSLNIYFNEINRYPLISPDEEFELFRRYKQGDQRAYDKLIACNLRFVVSEAKKFQGQGVPFEDLIQEGNLGLQKAATLFDETKGFKFITYAVTWIRQHLQNAVSQQGRDVRLPHNKVNDIWKVKKAIESLKMELYRDPTIAELAASTGLDEVKLLDLIHLGLPIESFDDPVDDKGESNRGDFFQSSASYNADRDLNFESLRKDLQRVIDYLPEKERVVMELLFGFNELEQVYSTEEAGEKLGISCDRVRQCKERAVRRLRNRVDLSFLRHYRAA